MGFMKQPRFELIAGSLCLDFANTVHCYGATDPQDDLRNYDDLIDWGLQTGVLEAAKRGRKWPPRFWGAGNLEKAREVRNLIYRIFSRIASRRAPRSGDLCLFSRKLAEALRHRTLSASGNSISWVWDQGSSLTERISWRILDSAANLLLSVDRARVRECNAPRCTWLFLDHSKNSTRKWCDMKRCGNREKSRRHYARTRSRSGRRRV